MATFKLFLSLSMTFLTCVPPQSAQSDSENFLIDHSKHYVYLKFDHVANRQPVSRGEVRKGLWLSLVNNCRIPIVVAIFKSGTSDQEISVYDEVVSVSADRPIVRFVDPSKNTPKQTARPRAKRPQGYSLPDVFSTATVGPGESLLFSVPFNHVDPSWALQVRFYLDLPGDAYGSGPYSVVSFSWQDVPEKFRKTADGPR